MGTKEFKVSSKGLLFNRSRVRNERFKVETGENYDSIGMVFPF